MSSGIEDLGGVRWQLAVCLLASWVIVYLCLCKGVKSSGKVVYFTALFPYVVLFALLVRVLTLGGYQEGIDFYLKPDWSRLSEAKIWNDAATQIFFSLGCGFGGLIALSSYNKFHNNCLRDALIVSIGNCLTSVFAGFVVFAYLGLLAKSMNTSVEDVVAGGFGLVFVVYPDAISRMPFPPVWAVLFFLMLITLGLDTQFANIEAVTTSLMDRWPELLPRKKKPFVMLTVCITFFLIGLIFCTNGAIYILEMCDGYVGGWSIMMVSFVECFALLWVYGWKSWSNDLRVMLGFRQFFWWRLCWEVISPAAILFVLFFAWADYKPLKSLPFYMDIIGWVITMCVVLPVPIGFIVVFLMAKGPGCYHKWINSIKPSKDWGPALVEHRRLVTYVPGFVIDPYRTSTKINKTNSERNNQAFEEDQL